jgi:hypothetical protein
MKFVYKAAALAAFANMHSTVIAQEVLDDTSGDGRLTF